MTVFKHEVFNEQLEFLKDLANKLGLPDEDYVRNFSKYYVQHLSNNERITQFLNRELGEYITKGKLENWVKDNINDHSKEELFNIDFFLNSCLSASANGNIDFDLMDPSNKKIDILDKEGCGHSLKKNLGIKI